MMEEVIKEIETMVEKNRKRYERSLSAKRKYPDFDPFLLGKAKGMLSAYENCLQIIRRHCKENNKEINGNIFTYGE